MHVTSLPRALVQEWHTIYSVSSGYHLSLIWSRCLSKYDILGLRSDIALFFDYFLLLSSRRVIRKVLVFHSRLSINLRSICGLSGYQLTYTGRLWLSYSRIIFIRTNILPLTYLLLTAVHCILVYTSLARSSPLLLTHSELISLILSIKIKLRVQSFNYACWPL